MQQLALRLRDVRNAAGLTYSQLSARTRYSMSGLSLVFAGKRFPTWEMVAAIARATDTDVQELRLLWEAARESAGAARTAGTVARNIDAVEPAALRAPPVGANRVMESAAREMQQRTVVHDLYQLAGRPSVRELADVTGLSRSAVHRAVSGQSVAGARRVADGLVARLAPDVREEWAAKITNVFEGAPPGTEDTAPFQALHASDREMVAEAFSEFERSLQRMRNLLAHGAVQAPTEIRAQVFVLAATIEETRMGWRPQSFVGGAEQSGGEARASSSAPDRKDDA
ncbi:helix-turn-helix domain-containing protein [Streptomyces sp. NBC_00028]|uniref:helix-turn-helix domain-containing protein n=1 Tax=Streptomyces sp. NBC_00028 TaxID=2975624 RepID=UPI003245E9D0